MKSPSLVFTAPRKVEVREVDVPALSEDEILVATEVSAISAGTELLLYRGELAAGTKLDERLPALEGELRYPVSYGYAAVGVVAEAGARVQGDWRGRRVLAFHPHRGHFVTRPAEVRLVPPDVSAEAASLLPTIETAVNLLLDAKPLVGERVLVVGQGVVGLVLTALLARFPLESLVTVDPLERRRRLSERLGAVRSFPPENLGERDFDLTFEVSGSPDALNGAIAATGVEGRVIVGSWYGDKRSEIDLGTHFHRGRLKLVSSQVSRLAPELLARWDRGRRMDVALEALTALPAADLVSHRIPISRAAEAYELLDRERESCLQVLLTYT
jgi:2-desacetyl-2-hydroxyethyl bacteriochlorophyllide A dehydrogenase